ncbi:MAG TPA: elongation factor G [Planctomycetaceae bacterium]|nr:elongation factor G [Planctomycetaceae bacterium]
MTRIERLRNIGISAHIDSGKTTLTERMLFYCGKIHQIHDVRGSDGVGATMDSDPIERRRGITISSAVTSVQWKEHQLQIIDTPGHVDFTVEVERALRVLDGAVMVLCSVGGVQSQSYTVDKQMRRYEVPRIAFVNKMDRVGANPQRVIQEMREQLGLNAVALQLPIGCGETFAGVIDLLTQEAVYFAGQFGEIVRREPIPSSLYEAAQSWRHEMVERLAMVDDPLMESAMAGHPSEDELRSAIRRTTLSHSVTPVLFGSAGRNCGVQELLDAVVQYLPAPSDRQVSAFELNEKESDDDKLETLALKPDDALPAVAMAFKTLVEDYGPVTFIRVYQGAFSKGKTYTNSRTGERHRFSRLVRMHADRRTEIEIATAGDLCGVVGLDSALGDTYVAGNRRFAMENAIVAEPVVQLAIEPHRHSDADRLAKALDRFRRQDPTFRFATDPTSGQMLIAGVGRLQLDVYVQRLKDEHACEVRIGPPQVAYLECPTISVPFDYRLKKQNGGQGQFAQISGRLEPLPYNAESKFEFVDEIVGGRVSKANIAAARDGFVDASTSGPLAKYPFVGVRVVLQDGSEHEKDSSEFAFRRCAWEVMRTVLMPHSAPALLEPMVHVSVEIPNESQGSVVGHLTRKRASLSSSQELERICKIEAKAPLSEMLDYATELRSLTQGQGTFAMSPAGYDFVPSNKAKLATVEN